jgi:RND family efflux transporter MFP subunit
LKSTNLHLLLKGAKAGRAKIRANLQYAEKELERAEKLKDTNSIAGKNYDEALYNRLALHQGFLESEAEIERLKYEIEQKSVVAPFSGFVAQEHTQVGQWINPGGAVVTLLDLGRIRITVDVPERYAVMISRDSGVKVIIKSISKNSLSGKIYAVLPQGNPDSRTFPVRINLPNPDFRIKSGMEAEVTFNLASTKRAMLVPKDAVVTAGNNRLVFLVANGTAIPVNVKILGYYDGNVAVEGNLQPGGRVVVRGNERLMPGQAIQVIK